MPEEGIGDEGGHNVPRDISHCVLAAMINKSIVNASVLTPFSLPLRCRINLGAVTVTEKY
ncbi:MAG: hypothetical protein ABSE75_10175 [Acidimicrobiales bacterium]|jgi:hypothetical protein